MAALAAGLFILPFFLFSAFAGQMADAFSKAVLVRRIKLAEIILMLIFSGLFLWQNVYAMLVLIFLMGSQSAFFGPIKYSLLPEQLKPSELLGGNGLIGGATFIAILLGTIFGGLVVGGGFGILLFPVTLIVFASIGWVASWFIPVKPAGNEGLVMEKNIFTQTMKILRHAYGEKKRAFTIIAISWFWLMGAVFLTQLPVFAKEILGAGEGIVVLFLTLFSVGIAGGALLCNVLLRGAVSKRLAPFGCMGMSGAIVLLFICTHFLPALPLIGLSLLLLAVCAGIYVIPLYAMLQKSAPKAHIARIIAANNIMNALFMVGANMVGLVLFSLHFTSLDFMLLLAICNPLLLLAIKKI